MTTRMRVATSGQPAYANDFAGAGNPGDVIKRKAGPTPDFDDVEWGPSGGGAIPAPALSHMIFVSPPAPNGFGSDVTGDGTMSKPYATIAHAQSHVVGATVLNPWSIILFPGDYPEDPVHLMAFTRIVGWDASSYQNAQFVYQERPAILDGQIDLGPSFAGADSMAVLTNVSCRGFVTLDYGAAAHPTASVVFANCNLVETTLYGVDDGALFNRTEFYNCELEGDFIAIGGRVAFYNTSGLRTGNNLSIRPAALRRVLFEAFGGSWAGSVTASQNAVEEPCELDLHGFSVGRMTVLSTALTNPIIVSDHGAIPENPTLGGGAAAALSYEMRVFQQLSIPAGTVIGAAGTTDVPIVLPAAVLGATNIERMVCSCTFVGTTTSGIIAANSLAITWVYSNFAGVDTLHAMIYHPGAGFNTPNPMTFTFAAYLPPIPVVP